MTPIDLIDSFHHTPLTSRDAELVRKIGEATALEVRATGIHWAFAPCLAVS
jgi:beta-glucosidase-like glycosyl hydrolase